MNEIQLSNNLRQIELEINWHKENAGKSIWEIGRRLNHVKEKDLVHGEFEEWINSIGINIREAQRLMKVASEIPKTTTLSHFGSTALYLIATLPEAEKQEQLQKIEQGETPTVRELQDLKRQLKAKDDEINHLKNKPQPQPRVQTVEVIPDDYEQLKQANEQLKQLQRDHQQLLDERAEVNEKSRKYDELNEAIRISQGRLNETQKKISQFNQLHKLIKESNEFLNRASTLVYSDLAELIQVDPLAKQEVKYMLNNLDRLSKDLNKNLSKQMIIEGEIIHDRSIS